MSPSSEQAKLEEWHGKLHGERHFGIIWKSRRFHVCVGGIGYYIATEDHSRASDCVAWQDFAFFPEQEICIRDVLDEIEYFVPEMPIKGNETEGAKERRRVAAPKVSDWAEAWDCRGNIWFKFRGTEFCAGAISSYTNFLWKAEDGTLVKPNIDGPEELLRSEDLFGVRLIDNLDEIEDFEYTVPARFLYTKRKPPVFKDEWLTTKQGWLEFLEDWGWHAYFSVDGEYYKLWPGGYHRYWVSPFDEEGMDRDVWPIHFESPDAVLNARIFDGFSLLDKIETVRFTDIEAVWHSIDGFTEKERRK
ncbi:MAG: hypothetical protein IKO55_01925 [Kiritimatiellae bacterium]|nr:hypothetical protein [Kiritimatiellia bacterium]